MTSYLIAALIGYTLGSIPFGLVLTYCAGLGDIRKIGSGNIGTTNVLRTGHKGLALLTLLLDFFKAALAAFLCRWLFSEDLGFFAGFMAVIGHNYPIWLKFKGNGIAAKNITIVRKVKFFFIIVFFKLFDIQFLIVFIGKGRAFRDKKQVDNPI